MGKEEVLARIRELGLLAVLRGPSAELTLQMVEALVAGGVRGIEVTYSTPDAAEVVRQLIKQYGERLLVGMGTLTRPKQAAEAQAAGAAFLVSPIVDEALAGAMRTTGLAIMLGALTPTEVVQAHRLGSDIVKIFPGSLVGPGYLRSLRGPFPDIPMMPTGGVNSENAAEWFAAGAVAVGAGSELSPTTFALEGRFELIKERARAFVQAVAEAKRK